MNTIHIEYLENIAILQLNRGKANAINAEMVNELLDALITLKTNDKVKGVVLTGHGEFFSAGLDVIELYSYDEHEIAEFWKVFDRLSRRIVMFPKPIVAAITGHSPAGGCVLAIGCDYRVMAEGNYRIGLNEVAVGIVVPEPIFHMYSFLVGRGKAHQYLLEGKLHLPEEALACNLVNEIAPLNEVLNRAIAQLKVFMQYNSAVWTKSKMNFRSPLIPELAVMLNNHCTMKLHLILFCLVSNCLCGQSFCDPFYVVGLSNKGRIWEAVFTDCVDLRESIIREDENPQLRALSIKTKRIRSISAKHSEDSIAKIEYFDNNGYLFFNNAKNDTANGTFILNEFSQNKLLIKATYKYKSSFSGLGNGYNFRHEYNEKFFYDKHDRLYKKKETTLSAVKNSTTMTYQKGRKFYKRPRKRVFVETTKYNKCNNIVMHKTNQNSKDIFLYNLSNHLIVAIDKSRHLMNAETKSFTYNENGLLIKIFVTYKSKSFKSHYINLLYNKDDQIIEYEVIYENRPDFQRINYFYEGGRLISIKNTNGIYTQQRKFYYDDVGLITRIDFLGNGRIPKYLDYKYEFWE